MLCCIAWFRRLCVDSERFSSKAAFQTCHKRCRKHFRRNAARCRSGGCQVSQNAQVVHPRLIWQRLRLLSVSSEFPFLAYRKDLFFGRQYDCCFSYFVFGGRLGISMATNFKSPSNGSSYNSRWPDGCHCSDQLPEQCRCRCHELYISSSIIVI